MSKDLIRILEGQGHSHMREEQPAMKTLMARLKDKPFWTWMSEKHKSQSSPRNLQSHGDCCFNHIIGLPSKNGEAKPMFSYEKEIYYAMTVPRYLNSKYTTLPRNETENMKEFAIRKKIESEIPAYSFKDKHVWIKKATGLGVTEFMLRFMAWLCLRNDDYKNSQMVIVTGPNQDIAIKLIKRMKAFFERHGITFDSKETVIELNGCSIEAYPSNHLDACRSLSNPKFILIEEGDFFSPHEQENVRIISERYIGKSDPYIVMVSTPYRPDGLFSKIEKEPFETCIYKKMFLDYTYGIDKIYSKSEIEKAKMSPSFEREYCLKYLGFEGNVLSSTSIDRCISLGEQMMTTAPRLMAVCRSCLKILTDQGESITIKPWS